MASGLRTFTITELSKSTEGTYVPTPRRFEWDSTHQSSPRNQWEYGLKQRTKRRDYPGSDLPTEQILGPNYEAFDLEGVWDDRYNFPGFAETTRIEMEKVIQRGNFVELAFEGLSITGVMTNLKIMYKRKYYIGYRFTFSPHYRASGGDVRKGFSVPDKIYSPQDNANQLASQCQALQEVHFAAPQPFIPGGLYDTLTQALNKIINSSTKVGQILSGRVLVITDGDQPVSSVSRLSQGFTDAFIAAASIPELLASIDSDNGLGYNTAILILQLEVWKREMAAQAREIMYNCALAAAQLAATAKVKALAIYKPHAGESLYGISNQFYGTPHRWRDIASRNALDTFILTGTETLVIPDVGSS